MKTEIDYSVVARAEIPEPLVELIEQKMEKPFQMTFQDKNQLYLVEGYGKQDYHGYSIQVDDLYLEHNTIYCETTLLGPRVEDLKQKNECFPYIVLMIEYRNEPIIFR